jgi:hypothetical protein
MKKIEALAQLEEHLSEAPFDLKEYALRSWWEQAEDVEGGQWISSVFLLWISSKEGDYFWDAIFYEKWQEAQDELSELNPDYDYINPNPYKPNWFERLPLHWRYIYHMAGGILIGYLLHYLF